MFETAFRIKRLPNLGTMSQAGTPADLQSTPTSEVSESAFEFLLCEILSQSAYVSLDNATDKGDVQLHRLDTLGYDVGYR